MAAFLKLAWPIVWKLKFPLIIAALSIALMLTRGTLERRTKELAAVRLDYRLFRTAIIDKTKDMILQNRADVKRIDDARDRAIKEKSNAYLRVRDAELAAVRERMRARSGPRGAGEAGPPQDAALPGGPVRPSGETDIHDAEICTVNTLRLESLIGAWQAAEAVSSQ